MASEYNTVHSRSEQDTAEASRPWSKGDEVGEEGEGNQGAKWGRKDGVCSPMGTRKLAKVLLSPTTG